MRQSDGALALCASALLLAVLAGAGGRSRETAALAAPTGQADRLERGRYLAENVAMCIQCHTPRDAAGNLLTDRKFQGAPVPVESPFRGLEWALQAPSITGMLGYDRQGAIRLLSQGLARDGRAPAAPMPPYRMHPEDAEAIYEYLSSLPASR